MKRQPMATVCVCVRGGGGLGLGTGVPGSISTDAKPDTVEKWDEQ